MIFPHNKKQKNRTLAALLLPGLIIIFFVFAVPILYSIYLSLLNFSRGVADPSFVGLDNYFHLFRDDAFWHSIRLTLYFVVWAVAIEIVLGLLIALLLNEKFWGVKLLRVLLLLPWAIPWVVNGIMWRWIYNPHFGPLNRLLRQFGFITRNINWLGEPARAMRMMILADVWKETSFIALLFLAGLQTIPEDYYEVAKIEGANILQRFYHITLPAIKPVLFVALSLRTIWAFKSFDLVYALTQGGPSRGTNLINFHIYQVTFRSLNFSYGATLSLILTLIILIITVIYYQVMIKEAE